jgi:hypothetical protein
MMETDRAEYADRFTVACSDSAIWKHLDAIAKYDGKKNATQVCADAIISYLEMFDDELLFSPKTGEALCRKSDLSNLQLTPNSPGEPPVERSGRLARGLLMNGHYLAMGGTR